MKKLILVLGSLFLVFAVNAQEVKADKKGGDSKKKMEHSFLLNLFLCFCAKKKRNKEFCLCIKKNVQVSNC